MSFLQILSDPNVQKFATPLVLGLLAVLGGWAGNQLPPLQQANQGGRVLKLAVEVAIAAVVVASCPDAVKAISGSDDSAQLAGVAYLIVLLLLLCAIAGDVCQLLRKRSPAQIAADEIAARQRSRRAALMDNVRYKWIHSVLESDTSLYQRSRIDLGLQACPELVRHLEARQSRENWRSLPVGTRIVDEFAALGEGGTLLIVGEPGGGKTTLLLELARDLLAKTDPADPEQSVPVVLNLSSWGTVQKERQPITTLKDWLVEELYGQYSARREVAAALLETEKLVLLLDGLDEVRREWRDGCVAAINQFQQDHGAIEMVVCCRIADYEALATGLGQFRSAVYIRPLDMPQVESYLQQAGPALAGFRQAMGQDAELQKLVSRPLFLAIATLAYKDRSAVELVNLSESERMQILFNRYIQQMFVQRPLPEPQQRQMRHWLGRVAQQMGSEKEFLIERMQPKAWLQRSAQRSQYRLIVGLIFGLIGSLIVGPIFGLIVGPIFGLILGLIGFLCVGLAVSLICGSKGDLDSIELVEALRISMASGARREVYNQLKQNLIWCLRIGLVLSLIPSPSLGLHVSLLMGLIIGLILDLNIGLLMGLKADIQARTYPNQGIILNSRNNLLFLGGVALVFTLCLYSALSHGLPFIMDHESATPIVFGTPPFLLLLAFFMGGGETCIRHLALRLVLHRAQLIPWNFVTFFQQAEDRLFVQRTGGSYIFIHRTLQEHFATLAD